MPPLFPGVRIGLLTAAAGGAALAGPAPAWRFPAGGPPPPVAPYTSAALPQEAVVLPLVFPVIGEVRWRPESYNQARGTHRHTGIDLLAPKLRPIVAPISGTLGFKPFSFWIVGEGAWAGWRVLGTHLNDDTPGTDDGKGDPDFMFAPNLRPGDPVVAGQLIGYVGNSSDASGSHLHFELHGPDGLRNPAPSLRRARKLSEPVPPPGASDGVQVAAGEAWVEGCPRAFHPGRAVLTLQLVSRGGAGRPRVVTTPTRLAVKLPTALVEELGGAAGLEALPRDRALRFSGSGNGGAWRADRWLRGGAPHPTAAPELQLATARAPSPPASRPGARHVSYGVRAVAGLTAHVLTVNLSEPTVRIGLALAPDLPAGDASWEELLSASRPVAAINGTFFDKGTLRPIGDLVVEGALRHAGRMGTVLAVTPDNRVTIRRVEWGRSQDWSAYRTVLGCGPTLVREGKVDVQPAAERFRDPQAVKLEQLARAMLALGCVDAMNLDGGASMALYYRGRTVLPPGRRLTNILTVHER